MIDVMFTIYQSIFSPHRVVKSIAASQDVPSLRWKIVSLAVVVEALSSALGWLHLRTDTNPVLLFLFDSVSAGTNAAISGLLAGLMALFGFLLGMWVWRWLFNFRDQSESIKNALAAVFAMGCVLTPASVILLAASGVEGASMAMALPSALLLIAGILVSSIYFSRALEISFLSALCRKVVATILVAAVMGLPLAILMFVKFAGTATAAVATMWSGVSM